MTHSLDWFTARTGSDILRGTTRITVTEDNAPKLYALQSDAYTFSDNESTPAPIRRISVSDSLCTACEG